MHQCKVKTQFKRMKGKNNVDLLETFDKKSTNKINTKVVNLFDNYVFHYMVCNPLFLKQKVLTPFAIKFNQYLPWWCHLSKKWDRVWSFVWISTLWSSLSLSTPLLEEGIPYFCSLYSWPILYPMSIGSFTKYSTS